MERVERVNAGQTLSAKEVNCLAIGATVCPFLAAEFAVVGSGGPPAFESNRFSEE